MSTRRGFLLCFAATLGAIATGAIPEAAIDAAIPPDHETWYIAWRQAVQPILAEFNRDLMCFGRGALVTTDVYPFMRIATHEELFGVYA